MKNEEKSFISSTCSSNGSKPCRLRRISASSTTAAGSAAESSEAAGNTAADASGKDSLVIVTSSDVLSMDPYRYDEGPTNQIMLHIYEAMVAQNADMSFGPCLAESWRPLRMV